MGCRNSYCPFCYCLSAASTRCCSQSNQRHTINGTTGPLRVTASKCVPSWGALGRGLAAGSGEKMRCFGCLGCCMCLGDICSDLIFTAHCSALRQGILQPLAFSLFLHPSPEPGSSQCCCNYRESDDASCSGQLKSAPGSRVQLQVVQPN